MFEYDKRLVPSKWVRQNEGTPAIGLSPGYPAWGLLYYAVLAHLRADKHNLILEVGTNYGTSTIIIAQALIDSGREGGIETIEIDPATAAIAADHFKEAGVSEIIDQLIGESVWVIRNLYNPVQIAFIDGSHECQNVVWDFEAVLNILRKDGLVIFDNTTMGGVHDALKVIKTNHGGNFVEFPCCSWSPAGMVFWKR